ncbi:MAG: glycoside hydrolase family 95 protein, partial [Duncaniella sp.]|nr:glycoside hydrolase family 95 protein [Duncaniella sp.]
MKLLAKTLIVTTAALSWLGASASQEHKLWYDKPAQVWTEALPLGNGRLGAMVYGNPANEQIQLNEETIWAGQPNNNANPEALEWIPKIRQLVFEGKYREAQDMATAHVKSKTNQGMPYQPFGDLRISFPGHTRYENYYRELSLDSARTVVKYTVDGVNYTRETFASFPDQVVITRITADRPGSVTFNAALTSPHPDVMIETEGDEITLSGVSSNHEGLKGKVEFQGRVKAVPKGGKVSARDGVISVENADEAVIYTSIATNFNNYKDITGDEVARSKEYLEKALKKPYADAKKEHVDFYQDQIGTSTLDLGPDLYADVPTDVRIERFAETHDNQLVANYYKFGRYLLVSSSQPGGQPANLQGIWNDKMFPSWDSKYTCNINLEMNYWPSEVTNLTHLNDPLFRLIKEVSQTGAESAKIMYGAPGWVLHHNTDIWRVTGAIDNAPSGMWLGGGAWLSRHLWEHYLHTGDIEFLREAYPIMKGA